VVMATLGLDGDRIEKRDGVGPVAASIRSCERVAFTRPARKAPQRVVKCSIVEQHGHDSIIDLTKSGPMCGPQSFRRSCQLPAKPAWVNLRDRRRRAARSIKAGVVQVLRRTARGRAVHEAADLVLGMGARAASQPGYRPARRQYAGPGIAAANYAMNRQTRSTATRPPEAPRARGRP
jgi:hypothetical protein